MSQRMPGRAARSRAPDRRTVTVGLIGAGKFGSMFLAQVPTTQGLAVAAIADLSPDRVRASLAAVGWDAARIAATAITEDAAEVIGRPDVEVVVEATGNPAAGIVHARRAIAAGKHVVMVNVEADALAGPLLAREAAAAGVVYTLAYGDQPALVCELVEWARMCGFDVVAAGKGTKYLPAFHASTPQTVWEHRGITAAEAEAAGMNAKMFNSFIDGTKSGIEMAAVANATGLDAPADGLAFPPAAVRDLPGVLCPMDAGGTLAKAGQVEVVSSVYRDGRTVPDNIRWGVFVVFTASSPYTRRCFREYGLTTDASGRFGVLFRPVHLIGLELNVSIFSAALRREATGAAAGFRADVAATAKRDLKGGERLDGEGGAMVWGKLMPAERSLAVGALPIGLAHLPLVRDVAAGATLTWGDVAVDAGEPAYRYRRDMEAAFRPVEPGIDGGAPP
jgi:predicted homoserine dehydrogenase-like protein